MTTTNFNLSDTEFRDALQQASSAISEADGALGTVAAAVIMAGLFRKEVTRLHLVAESLPASSFKRVLSLCKAAFEGGYQAEDMWNINADGATALKREKGEYLIQYTTKEFWEECQAFWRAAINRLASARCLRMTTLEGLLAKPKKQVTVKEGTVKAFLAKMDKAMSSGTVDTAELAVVKALLERCRDLM